MDTQEEDNEDYCPDIPKVQRRHMPSPLVRPSIDFGVLPVEIWLQVLEFYDPSIKEDRDTLLILIENERVTNAEPVIRELYHRFFTSRECEEFGSSAEPEAAATTYSEIDWSGDMTRARKRRLEMRPRLIRALKFLGWLPTEGLLGEQQNCMTSSKYDIACKIIDNGLDVLLDMMWADEVVRETLSVKWTALFHRACVKNKPRQTYIALKIIRYFNSAPADYKHHLYPSNYYIRPLSVTATGGKTPNLALLRTGEVLAGNDALHVLIEACRKQELCNNTELLGILLGMIDMNKITSNPNAYNAGPPVTNLGTLKGAMTHGFKSFHVLDMMIDRGIMPTVDDHWYDSMCRDPGAFSLLVHLDERGLLNGKTHPLFTATFFLDPRIEQLYQRKWISDVVLPEEWRRNRKGLRRFLLQRVVSHTTYRKCVSWDKDRSDPGYPASIQCKIISKHHRRAKRLGKKSGLAKKRLASWFEHVDSLKAIVDQASNKQSSL